MSWLIQSRKAQVAVGAIITLFLTHLLKQLNFTDDEIKTINSGVLVIAGVWIAGIAHEDASRNKVGFQLNQQSEVKNTAPIPTDSPNAPAVVPPSQAATTDQIVTEVVRRLAAVRQSEGPLVTTPGPPPATIVRDAPKGA